MAVQLNINSHLRFADLVSVDGVEFFDVIDLPKIPEQVDDIVYRVTQADRIDLLADRFYNNSLLWWVIAVANDLEILHTDLNTGDELRIPSPRFVAQNLFATASVR